MKSFWLLLGFLLQSVLAFGQLSNSGAIAGAVGFDLPMAGQWGEARHFPQASSKDWLSATAGARIAAFPGLASMNLGQIGAMYRWKVYHAAAYADFFGDALFGWQHYHLSGGLPLGKVRFGAGIGLYRWWVSELSNQQWQGKFGLSGSFRGNWNWHLAYQSAVPQPLRESLLAGAPPSRAFIAIAHSLGPVNLWATYLHQASTVGDYGLAMIWRINPQFQFDLATAPRSQRISMGFMWTYRGLQWHVQARWQQLPGLWYDNTLFWRSSHVP